MVASATIKTGLGVFVGFSAAKKVPPMLGAQMNSSPMMSILSTAITAGVVAWAAKRFAPGPFADGALWGGVGGVINVVWNTYAPASIAGYAGVGDFVAATQPWLLPRGPVGLPAASFDVAAGAQVNSSAWAPAW